VSHDLLNANQRRHFEVLLSMIERALLHVERTARLRDFPPSVLSAVTYDLPEDFAARLPSPLREARTTIGSLAALLQLSQHRTSARRSVQAALSTCIIRIDDASPQELTGYGAVHPQLFTEMGPLLDDLRKTLTMLSNLASRPASGRADGGGDRP